MEIASEGDPLLTSPDGTSLPYQATGGSFDEFDAAIREEWEKAAVDDHPNEMPLQQYFRTHRDEALVVFLLFLGLFGNAFSSVWLFVVETMFQDDQDISDGFFATMIACVAFVYGVSKLVHGIVSSKYISPYPMFRWSIAGTGVLSAAAAAGPNKAVLFIVFSVQAAVMCASFIAMVNISAEWVIPSRQGKAQGAVYLAYLVGSLVGRGLCGGLVALGFGWRAVGVFAAFVTVACAIPTFTHLTPPPPDRRKTHPSETTSTKASATCDRESPEDDQLTLWESLKPLFREPPVLAILLLSFLLYGLVMFFETYATSYLVDVYCKHYYDDDDDSSSGYDEVVSGVGRGDLLTVGGTFESRETAPLSESEMEDEDDDGCDDDSTANAVAAWGSIVLPLFGIVSVVFTSRLKDRLSRHFRAVACVCLLVLCVVPALLLTIFPKPHLSVAILGYALFGLGTIGPFSLLAGVFSIEVAGDAKSGALSSIVDSVGSLGVVGCSLMKAALGDDWSAVHGMVSVVLACSIAACGVLLYFDWHDARASRSSKAILRPPQGI